MWKTTEGSTGRLLQLCLGYFCFYVIFGVATKYFQGSPAHGFPGLTGLEYLVYSTLGGTVVALFVCLVLRWYRLRSNRLLQWGPLRFPCEWLYIVPSGVCTAVVIPTTTLMYSLPISVMVAMVIMRGAIIVVGRLVDEVQIRQGLLHKRVYFEENTAIVFALLAMGTTILLPPSVLRTVESWLGMGIGAPNSAAAAGGAFDFLHSKAATTILGTYVVAYAIRIYIMNYYKNTRGKGVPLDNKGFFAVEQLAAFATLVVGTAVLLALPAPAGPASGGSGAAAALGSADGLSQLALFQRAFHAPRPHWGLAALAGLSFGIVAFFSVFIFMFKGRTATFAGLVNRLTSLVAGTTSTLVFHYAYGGKLPTAEDWLSLVFILIAVGFLTRAERKRTAELVSTQELAPAPRPGAQSTGTSRA